MVKNLSPILRRELENLDKDADSRKSAMKALKLYVKDLDSKAIPLFLAQVSETRKTGVSAGEYTISLYEVLARVHGPKIVPQIDNIMTTIIKTLTLSAGSFALHQACSKVVPAIARYGIDPTTPEEKKRCIVHSLCKPLSDCLLGSQESLSSGVALCLKALVDSDNWRFASGEMVNEVCQKVAGALDRHVQTNSLMALVMSLAKHNSLIVEAYARLLIQSGLQILNAGVKESNSQKRLSAIQMVNFLMKCLDPKSTFSELNSIVEEMEKCQSDQMPYVKGAAFEALQTAKEILTEKGSKFERDMFSVTGSNFGTRENSPMKIVWGAGDQASLTASPESQTVDSFIGYDSLIESPSSMSQASRCLEYNKRSVNRKLWQVYENGGVDVSLKDGLFSVVTQGGATENRKDYYECSDNQGHYRDDFVGFSQENHTNGFVRSDTPSPQRSRSQINIDNIKIFTTPRKLIRSLQDANDVSSDLSSKPARRFRSPTPSKLEWTPASKNDQGSTAAHGVNHETERKGHSPGSSESVSSTKDVPVDTDGQVPAKIAMALGVTEESVNASMKKKSYQKSVFTMTAAVLVILCAVFIWMFWIDDQGRGQGHALVPT